MTTNPLSKSENKNTYLFDSLEERLPFKPLTLDCWDTGLSNKVQSFECQDFSHTFSMVRSISRCVSPSITRNKFQIAAPPQLGQRECFAREITLQSSQITASARGI